MLEKFLFYRHNCSDVFELQPHMPTLYGIDNILVTLFEKGGYLLFRIKTLAPKLKVGFVFYPLLLYA